MSEDLGDKGHYVARTEPETQV